MRYSSVLAMILLAAILAASPSWAVEFCAEQNGKVICQSSAEVAAVPVPPAPPVLPVSNLQVGQTVPVISGGQHYVIIKDVRGQPPVIKREVYIRQRNILKKIYLRVDDEKIKRDVMTMVATQLGQLRVEFDGKLAKVDNARVTGDVQLAQSVANESFAREAGDSSNLGLIAFCVVVISLGLFAVVLLV